MRTQNQTPTTNNALIWVIRIDLDGSYWYFSDTLDKITLGATDFDGKVIFKDSFGELENMCDIVNGGSFGQVGNFTFSLARWNDYSGVSNFFNDVYPQTSKPLLTAKTVDVGYVWSGANALNQITWEAKFYIQDYSFPSDSELRIVCYAKDELGQKQLPYYTIQKDIDNGISYYANTEDEETGSVLPVIYGNLYTTTPVTQSNLLAPIIRASKDNYFKICSHNCHTIEDSLYQYVSGANAMITLTADTVTLSNTRAGASLSLDTDNGNLMTGSVWITPKPKNITAAGSVTDKNNSVDKDNDTYAVLPAVETFGSSIQIRLNGISTDSIGGNNGNAADIKLMVKYKTTTSGDVLQLSTAPTILSQNYQPNNTNINDAAFEIGTLTVDALGNQTLYIASLDTNVGDIYIYEIYILMPNQLVYALDYEIAKVFIKEQLASSSRWLYGGNNPMKEVNKNGTRIVKETLKSEVAIKNTDNFVAVKGYIADLWINSGTRTAGIADGDLLEAPAAIIESFIADEICTERDLIIDSVSGNDVVFDTITPLNSAINDFYNGAILVNVTKDGRYTVSDYVGSTKTLTLSSTPTGWAANDKCYLKNINTGIDITTFDAIQASQISAGWEFARVLTSQQNSQDTLSQLLFESFCMLAKSYDEYKSIDLTATGNVGTLGTPIWEDGKPLFSTALTPFDNIYTDFTLNYGYDYTRKIYSKRKFVNKNGNSTGVGGYLEPLETDCASAETNYKIKRKYEYNADWIQDDTTANYLLEAIVKWFTYQRMIVYATYDCATYLQYEVGDRVLINYDFMIPTVKNNSQEFIIMGKNIDLTKKKIQFTLLY